MSLTETIKDRVGDQNLMTPSMPIKNGLMSDEEVFLLIDAWREINQLYNVKHPKYHLKDKRTKNLGLLA